MDKRLHVLVVPSHPEQEGAGKRPGYFEPLCELPRVEWTILLAERLRPASLTVWLPDGAGAPPGRLASRCRFLSGSEICTLPLAGNSAGAPDREAAEELLVLSADLPLVTSETVRELVDRHRSSGAGATWLLTPETGAGGLAALGIVEAEAIPPGWPASSLENKAGRTVPESLRQAVASAWFQVETGGADRPEELLPVRNRAAFVEAERVLQDRIIRHWLRAGVTVRRPDRVWIGPRVVLDPQVRLWWDVSLVGDTAVAAGGDLLPGTFLENARLGPGVRVEQSVVRDSEIQARTTVGPFAHIRGGAVVGPDNRVGNFVEIKKSVTGAGTKASHLAYLGDATIGARVNIGAGTITCNYDGVNKNPTEIGDGAFIGSDSILVAPLQVGAGAYVGAGSTITKNVPPDSLALGRARQRNIAGWACQRREKKPRP